MLRVFAQTHAVVAERKLCFRRLKKDGENCDELYGKKGEKGEHLCSAPRDSAKSREEIIRKRTQPLPYQLYFYLRTKG